MQIPLLLQHNQRIISAVYDNYWLYILLSIDLIFRFEDVLVEDWNLERMLRPLISLQMIHLDLPMRLRKNNMRGATFMDSGDYLPISLNISSRNSNILQYFELARNFVNYEASSVILIQIRPREYRVGIIAQIHHAILKNEFLVL